MCFVARNGFNDEHVPTRAQLNFLKGMVHGALGDGASNGEEFCVRTGWIVRNLPNALANADDLIDVGWVRYAQGEVNDVPYSDFTLEDGAVEWVITNLGLFGDRGGVGSDDADAAWLAANPFKPRAMSNPGRNGFKASVKTTTTYVRQFSYTPAEAKLAHTEVYQMEARGFLSERSSAAIRAHITRRIQQIAA